MDCAVILKMDDSYDFLVGVEKILILQTQFLNRTIVDSKVSFYLDLVSLFLVKLKA